MQNLPTHFHNGAVVTDERQVHAGPVEHLLQSCERAPTCGNEDDPLFIQPLNVVLETRRHLPALQQKGSIEVGSNQQNLVHATTLQVAIAHGPSRLGIPGGIEALRIVGSDPGERSKPGSQHRETLLRGSHQTQLLRPLRRRAPAHIWWQPPRPRPQWIKPR